MTQRPMRALGWGLVLIAAVGLFADWLYASSHAQADVAPRYADMPPAYGSPQTPKAGLRPADPGPSAEQLTLYRRRLADYRSVEDRLFGPPPGEAVKRPVVSHNVFKPLSAAEIRVAEAAGDETCLTQAIYHEARSEPEQGQAAVAKVVMNRVRNRLFPKSVCGVVFQGASRAGCQFTFACDGSVRRTARDGKAWETAHRIAGAALAGSPEGDAVGAAVNYHADYVHPHWAGQLFKVGSIGRHIFYEPAPGALPPGGEPPASAHL